MHLLEALAIVHGASTLVAIGTAAREPFADADCWLAAQDPMLAAHGAGLAGCCVDFALQVLNADDVEQTLQIPRAARWWPRSCSENPRSARQPYGARSR